MVGTTGGGGGGEHQCDPGALLLLYCVHSHLHPLEGSRGRGYVTLVYCPVLQHTACILCTAWLSPFSREGLSDISIDHIHGQT